MVFNYTTSDYIETLLSECEEGLVILEKKSKLDYVDILALEAIDNKLRHVKRELDDEVGVDEGGEDFTQLRARFESVEARVEVIDLRTV